jgi:glycosyltransferase involved in cell wall biosynthesis
MKVGIFLSDLKENSGGGYTFQTDIFEALETISQSRSQSNSHTFVVLGNVNTSTIIETIPYRLSLWEKIVKRSLNWSPIFYKIWQHTSKLEKLIKAQNIEILWFVSLDFIPANLPYIVSTWDLQHRLQPWFPEVSHNGQWDRRERDHAKVLRSASIILTGTEVGKKEVEYFYQVPTHNIKVVPFATPSFVFNIPNPNEETSEDMSEESTHPFKGLSKGLDRLTTKSFLFYPAQFWSHKNHIGLLQAVQILRDRHSLNFPVIFVGADKGNQKYIEQAVTDLKLNNIYFLGFVSQKQLVWLYRHAFALVFPTFFGPDNLPPLEAFALGCPVIASKVAGAEEQLGNAALLFDPKQPEDLAIAIKSLWKNPELRQNLIDLGLIRAKQWTAIDYVNLICQILDDFAPIRRSWDNK